MSIFNTISDDLVDLKQECFDRYFVRTYNNQDPREQKHDVPNWNRFRDDIITWKNNHFGLFTPYQSYKNAGISLALPFIAPIGLAIASALLTAFASLMFTIAAINILLTGGAALARNIGLVENPSFQANTFELADLTAKAGLIASGLALACAIFSGISAPLTAVNVLTRSGATAWEFCVSSSDVEDAQAPTPG